MPDPFVTGARRVVIGRIVRAHGLQGCVQVRYFGDGPDNLLRASAVSLGASEVDPEAVDMEVVSAVSGRAGEVRMTFAGVNGREAASKLRGRLVMVLPEQLERLREGEYYEYQLIGCRVQGENGREIGTVREIWATGATDILVVEDVAGGQHLIPTGGDFLRKVDVDGRRIVVETIPGLLDTP